MNFVKYKSHWVDIAVLSKAMRENDGIDEFYQCSSEEYETYSKSYEQYSRDYENYSKNYQAYLKNYAIYSENYALYIKQVTARSELDEEKI